MIFANVPTPGLLLLLMAVIAVAALVVALAAALGQTGPRGDTNLLLALTAVVVFGGCTMIGSNLYAANAATQAASLQRTAADRYGVHLTMAQAQGLRQYSIVDLTRSPTGAYGATRVRTVEGSQLVHLYHTRQGTWVLGTGTSLRAPAELPTV